MQLVDTWLNLCYRLVQCCVIWCRGVWFLHHQPGPYLIRNSGPQGHGPSGMKTPSWCGLPHAAGDVGFMHCSEVVGRLASKILVECVRYFIHWHVKTVKIYIYVYVSYIIIYMYICHILPRMIPVDTWICLVWIENSQKFSRWFT